MKKAFLKLALLLLALMPISAFAADNGQACDDVTVEIIDKHLKLQGKEFYLHDNKTDSGIVVAEACKLSPQNKNVVLTTFAYDLFDKSHPEKEWEKELIVAMVNLKTKRVLSSYRETIGEDAITEVGESSLKIDAAQYQLNKNTRAFGLRFESSAHGANCGGAYWGDELTLFMQKGNHLEPVLWSLPMYFMRFLKGCPASPSIEDVETEFAFLTIDVQKTSKNGYADLLLTAHINNSDERDLKPKPTDEKRLLRYDGKRYVLDNKLKSWWMLDSW